MTYYKYPKTMHLPWSPGLQNDDRLIESLDGFAGQRVIVTEKYDGENASLYNDHYHARSLDSRHHPSRDWIKMFHGQISHAIPDGYRICGENLYAEHSIQYNDLPSYFIGFSVWNETLCLDWDNTLEIFDLLGIVPARVLYDGMWDQDIIQSLEVSDRQEGYVVRLANGFPLYNFAKYVAKYVRRDHVQTDQHWMSKPVVANKLRDSTDV